MVSKISNKIHQTWGQPYSRSLYVSKEATPSNAVMHSGWFLCAFDNSLDEVVAEHLLEVGDVAVVHDGEVLLVDVQVGEVEGHVGEPQPEAVVGVYLGNDP